jgi:predicted small secreted protein
MKTVALLIALVTLAACNTIEGAGQDIGKAGSAISNTAKEVEKKL